jgi:hypothetical protein
MYFPTRSASGLVLARTRLWTLKPVCGQERIRSQFFEIAFDLAVVGQLPVGPRFEAEEFLGRSLGRENGDRGKTEADNQAENDPAKARFFLLGHGY